MMNGIKKKSVKLSEFCSDYVTGGQESKISLYLVRGSFFLSKFISMMVPNGLNLNMASRIILHFANPPVNGQILHVENCVEM